MSSYRQLKAEWYKRLKESGFIDLEDRRGNLFQPDTRTIAWQNRERILEFFIQFDYYLTHNSTLSQRDRHILTRWSEGTYLVDISKELRISLSTINKVIAHHKRIVLHS